MIELVEYCALITTSMGHLTSIDAMLMVNRYASTRAVLPLVLVAVWPAAPLSSLSGMRRGVLAVAVLIDMTSSQA